MLPGTQFNEPSLPLPMSRELATSFNGASQARRAIGGASRRPMVAGKLANHERVLQPYRTVVSRDGRQSFPYGSSAPRPAREGNEAGFRVRFVFGSETHAVFRDPKKARNSISVGQEPRLHRPDRDPEAHSKGGIGKVPLKPKRCAILPVEITKRKPRCMASSFMKRRNRVSNAGMLV